MLVIELHYTTLYHARRAYNYRHINIVPRAHLSSSFCHSLGESEVAWLPTTVSA
jgi:hypothetical protein